MDESPELISTAVDLYSPDEIRIEHKPVDDGVDPIGWIISVDIT
jgi:hypothetical protein